MIFQGDAASEIEAGPLLLRAPRRGDLEPLDQAIRETLDALVLWLPWARPEHSRGDTRRFLRGARIARSRRHTFEFLVLGSDSGSLLGVASLHRIDWIRRSAGIGYWTRKSEWGHGVATGAARAMLELAFRDLRLHRVEVHVALENKASQRVAERLGLIREGVARGSEFVNGRYLDHIQYAMLSTDFLGDV